MNLETWDGRNCLFGLEGANGVAVFKQAYQEGLLPGGQRVFLGSSSFFCSVQGNIMRTYRMRYNWNGWHDVAAYSLPTFAQIGTKTLADSSCGRHRDTVTIP